MSDYLARIQQHPRWGTVTEEELDMALPAVILGVWHARIMRELLQHRPYDAVAARDLMALGCRAYLDSLTDDRQRALAIYRGTAPAATAAATTAARPITYPRSN